MADINLLIHYFPKVSSGSDFAAIAERIHAMAPEISVEVLATTGPHPLAMVKAAAKPTVSVEFNRAKLFRPLRGKVFRQWYKSPKSRQYRVLEAAGLPVPKWTSIAPGTVLDPAEWGDHVIEKPDRGTTGIDIRVAPTSNVRFRASSDLDKDHLGRVAGMLAQRMIYTGPWPVSHRVTTLFGTPLIAIRYEAKGERLFSGGSSGQRAVLDARPVSIGKGSVITTFDDAEIIGLARRTHGAFPEVPVLGTDIIRNPDDGSLWILEVNPDGNCWPLGSEYGRLIMERDGLDLYGQFDGLDKAADVLVDICRTSAV